MARAGAAAEPIWAPLADGVHPRLWRIATASVRAGGRVRYGYRVGGAGNVPATGGVLLAVNHLAEVDPAFVCSALGGRPGLSLATARHFTSPAVARLLWALGAMPVRAGGGPDLRVVRHARERLLEGHVVIVYPEGVPGYSSAVGPFAEGAGHLALTPGVTVVPGAIWGSHRLMRHGLPVGRGPVTVAFGAPITVPGEGPRRLRAAEASRRLRAAVADLVAQLAARDPDP